jgi:hypothetical protein
MALTKIALDSTEDYGMPSQMTNLRYSGTSSGSLAGSHAFYDYPSQTCDPRDTVIGADILTYQPVKSIDASEATKSMFATATDSTQQFQPGTTTEESVAVDGDSYFTRAFEKFKAAQDETDASLHCQDAGFDRQAKARKALTSKRERTEEESPKRRIQPILSCDGCRRYKRKCHVNGRKGEGTCRECNSLKDRVCTWEQYHNTRKAVEERPKSFERQAFLSFNGLGIR